jgi:uncharacterized protein (TIGR03382 family)
MTAKLGLIGWAGAVLVAWSALAMSAHAQRRCFSEGEDCGYGYVCRTYKEVYCADGNCGPDATAGRAAAGGAGGSSNCDGTIDWCEARTWGYCEWPSCTSDDDCMPGVRCMQSAGEECRIADPCPGEDSCPIDPDHVPTCTSVGRPSMCVPPGEVDCTTDADCDDGLDCAVGGGHLKCDCGEEQGGIGGGDAEPCDCVELNHCAPREITCKTAADCPANFSCELHPCAYEHCEEELARGAAGGGPGCGPDPSRPRLCRPPKYYGIFSRCSSSDGSAGHPSSGAGGASGHSTDAGVADAAPPRADHHHDSARSPFGCSAAPTTAADAFGSFGLMALAVLGIRRRARHAIA